MNKSTGGTATAYHRSNNTNSIGVNTNNMDSTQGNPSSDPSLLLRNEIYFAPMKVMSPLANGLSVNSKITTNNHHRATVQVQVEPDTT